MCGIVVVHENLLFIESLSVKDIDINVLRKVTVAGEMCQCSLILAPVCRRLDSHDCILGFPIAGCLGEYLIKDL